MQDLVNNSAEKEIHELRSFEFINFNTYLNSRVNRDTYSIRDVEIPAQIASPLDTCTFPLGSKLWSGLGEGIDRGVFVLKEFQMSEVNIRSHKYSESQEHLLGRNVTIEIYTKLYLEGATFPPLIGYQQGSDIYLLDGNRRFLAAKKANIQTIQIFVEEVDSNGITKNRRAFIEEAISENKTVDPAILEEVYALSSFRERKTIFRYQEKRRNEYPSFGDQIGALMKAASGDNSELNVLLQKINQTKNKYPKPISE